MDDDGSALRVGAKYKSFTDLECALKIFQQDNYVSSVSEPYRPIIPYVKPFFTPQLCSQP
jgi:hypothetical protein